VGEVAEPARQIGEVSEAASLFEQLVEHHKIVMAILGGILLLAAYVVHRANGPQLLRLALIVPSDRTP